jgi:hypothetical protein
MKQRVYPVCCQSMQCGSIDCANCERLPVLEEFKRWVKDNDAVCEDSTWCPTVYTARKGQR